jgi:tRNA(Arg) A34 adenosine deaminase TadA
VRLLHAAARHARELQVKYQQGFYLAAIGVRRDGAIVRATNKALRDGSSNPIPSTHAEARLCRKLDAGADVYVARVTRDGSWAMSRPCEGCQSALRARRVRRVYYTIGPGEYGVMHL